MISPWVLVLVLVVRRRRRRTWAPSSASEVPGDGGADDPDPIEAIGRSVKLARRLRRGGWRR
jgi:hypothetical protein